MKPRQWSYQVLRGVLASWPVLLCLLVPAAPSQPPAMPVLRIEAGSDTAMISRVDVDADERYLVTVSNDETARVWSLASGELRQVLRPLLGPDNDGKLYAVAISPDGATVAVAGETEAATN